MISTCLDEAEDLERDLEDRRDLPGRFNLERKPDLNDSWDLVQPADEHGSFSAVQGRDRSKGKVIILKRGKVGIYLLAP